MDPQNWNRGIEYIEHNPIATGLNTFCSIARNMGVCDITAVDQLNAQHLQSLALLLMGCLSCHTAVQALSGWHGSLSDDLIQVSIALMKNHIGDDCFRPLLKAAITRADVRTLWIEFFTLSATLEATHAATGPPTPRSTSPQYTWSIPITQTSSPIINVSEHHRLPAASISPNSIVSQHLQPPSKWHDLDDERLAFAKRAAVRLHSDFAATAERDFMPFYKPLIPYVNQIRELLPFNAELPGQVLATSEVPRKTGFELYSQMIGVLREAQMDPEVRAE
ncbi:hypothetical protein E4U50_007300 [Claviceps purpurea]|nr:hypothetical protein E4U50_007300 [Claviceps purpurea]